MNYSKIILALSFISCHIYSMQNSPANDAIINSAAKRNYYKKACTQAKTPAERIHYRFLLRLAERELELAINTNSRRAKL